MRAAPIPTVIILERCVKRNCSHYKEGFVTVEYYRIINRERPSSVSVELKVNLIYDGWGYDASEAKAVD